LATGTVAVIAGGIDVIYPPEHESLYKSIAEKGGAVVTEMPLSMHPGSTHFPRRNRIISGLSKGVAVVEAAFRSGSLITARYALEQNRELFAVPGAPYDPRCQGTNELLKNGAHLLGGAQDILAVLEGEKIHLEEPVYPFIAAQVMSAEDQGHLKQSLLNDLSATPISIDVLVEQYACKAQEIMPILLEFELAGMVQRSAKGMVSRLY
jgi:DNA processing protein